MAKSERVPRSLITRLQDLDDHLYLLEDALIRLKAGESAHLKSLAAELRVLVCYSSGTEGLLWRISVELGVHDAIHVHHVGNIDYERSSAKGLEFLYFPIFKAGEGDPRLPIGDYSLRSIIKEHEALIVTGKGYTHEQIIKAFSQQMGSAHEDDGIEPYLAELSEVLILNQKPLMRVLLSDACFVIEVGKRVMEQAEKTHDYTPKSRQKINIEKQTLPKYIPKQVIPDNTHATISDEGTVVFQIDHPHPDWCTNSNKYVFGELRKGQLSISPTKHTDCTVELAISGLGKKKIVSKRPIPESEFPGIAIAITWQGNEVNIYLNGQLVDRIVWD